MTKENIIKVLKYFVCQVLFLGLTYWGIAVNFCVMHRFSTYTSRLTYCLCMAIGSASCILDYRECIKQNGLFLAPKSLECLLVFLVIRGRVPKEFLANYSGFIAEVLCCGLLAVGSEKKYIQGFVSRLTGWAWYIPPPPKDTEKSEVQRQIS